MLDAHQLVVAVTAPVPAGHVAGGHHPVGGEEAGVAHHPVVDHQARAAEPLDGGTTPIPTTTTSAGSEVPSVSSTRPAGPRRATGRRAGRRVHGRHPDPGAQRHPVAAVEGRAGRAHRLAQGPGSGAGSASTTVTSHPGPTGWRPPPSR